MTPLAFIKLILYLVGVILFFINWKTGFILLLVTFIIFDLIKWASNNKLDIFNKEVLKIDKTKITDEDLIHGLASLLNKDFYKTPLKDTNGEIILTQDEQLLLALSHICTLLDKHGLERIKMRLTAIFIHESYTKEEFPKTEEDMLVAIAVALSSVDRVNKFMKELPADISELTGKWFLFDKKINVIQKFKIISWYTERAKMIDSTIYSTLLEK